MMIYGWDHPYNMIRDEIRQLQFEGKIIPDRILKAFGELDPERDRYNEAVLADLFADLQRSESFSLKDNWDYVQPDDWDDIVQCRPAGLIKEYSISEEALVDKLHGAWSGRAAGCALGKPVEIIGLSGESRSKIKKALEKADDWPLSRFFSAAIHDDDFPMICPLSWRENIAYMEPDDDIHYTLIALAVLEKYGKSFTWRNVADTWNQSLPFGAICTAETQAILNYNMRTHWLEREKAPISPDFTSRFNNPYREWIGAQIRADGWAYCSAGKPEQAANFAWRDARWTHRGNGIYGEMFTAAMIAAAFVENDPVKVIEVGLSVIPERSILAEAVREALIWFDRCETWEDFMDRLDQKYRSMSAVHTINNALVCIMSLYYGEMDPDRSISIAVMAGLDTDCNGATVGSITGAAGGRAAFGSHYVPELNDRIKPMVFGFQEVTMKALADRCLEIWKKKG